MDRCARKLGRLALAVAVSIVANAAYAQSESTQARIKRLEAQVQAQSQRLDTLEQTLTEREFEIAELKQAVGLDDMRARGVVANPAARPAPAAQAKPQQTQTQQRQTPVGQAPPEPETPPQVAQIFDQPSVLTPAGSSSCSSLRCKSAIGRTTASRSSATR